MNENEKTIEEIKAMIESIKDLKASFEPVKEKALEQQIYFKGYTTGAAQLLEIMETRIKNFENQIENLLKAPQELKKPEEEVQQINNELVPEKWVSTVKE